MITVNEDNLIKATKSAFIALYEGNSTNFSDQDLLKEDIAIIEVANPSQDKNVFELKENTLFYIDDYQQYFPDVDPDLANIEQEHYTDVIIKEGLLDALQYHLEKHPSSRRGLISTWSPIYYDLSIGGVCVTQLYFRVRNGLLEVHSHLRANDAYRLLLMDMQLAIWAQNELSKRLNIPKGRYIHFVDSLQFYKKFKTQIDKQYEFMMNSLIWQ
jgi:hypothetical protein